MPCPCCQGGRRALTRRGPPVAAACPPDLRTRQFRSPRATLGHCPPSRGTSSGRHRFWPSKAQVAVGRRCGSGPSFLSRPEHHDRAGTVSVSGRLVQVRWVRVGGGWSARNISVTSNSLSCRRERCGTSCEAGPTGGGSCCGGLGRRGGREAAPGFCTECPTRVRRKVFCVVQRSQPHPFGRAASGRGGRNPRWPGRDRTIPVRDERSSGAGGGSRSAFGGRVGSGGRGRDPGDR